MEHKFNEQLEKDKYWIEKDFVPKNILSLCQTYYPIKFFIKKDFEIQLGKLHHNMPDIVQPYSVKSYADSLSESLLAFFLEDIRRITGIPTLRESYSFVRLYETGQWVEPHHDRPSCQYSITLPLVQYDDTPWSIYVNDVAVDLNVGDMVIYKGCEATHFREPFHGKYQVQAHLHYVDGGEEAYYPHILDGRKSLGEVPERSTLLQERLVRTY